MEEAKSELKLDAELAPSIKEDLIKLILDKLKKLVLKSPPEVQHEIAVFFNNIDQIYKLYEEERKAAFLLIETPAMQRNGGIQELNTFGDLYANFSLKDIENHFFQLKQLLKKSPIRVGLLIENFNLDESNHVIAVGYNASTEEWTLYDANHAPSLTTKDINKIARRVISTESGNEVKEKSLPLETCRTSFSARVFVAGVHNDLAIQDIIGKWVNMITINQFIANMNVQNINSNSPIYLAACRLQNIIEDLYKLEQIQPIVSTFDQLKECHARVRVLYEISQEKNNKYDKETLAELENDLNSAFLRFANHDIKLQDTINFIAEVENNFKKKEAIIKRYNVDFDYQDKIISTLETVLTKIPTASDKHKKLTIFLEELKNTYCYDRDSLEHMVSRIKKIAAAHRDTGIINAIFKLTLFRNPASYKEVSKVFDENQKIISKLSK